VKRVDAGKPMKQRQAMYAGQLKIAPTPKMKSKKLQLSVPIPSVMNGQMKRISIVQAM
jgi:hypothetical protein